jgi:hypothetical protein
MNKEDTLARPEPLSVDDAQWALALVEQRMQLLNKRTEQLLTDLRAKEITMSVFSVLDEHGTTSR